MIRLTQKKHRFLSYLIHHGNFGTGYTSQCSCGWALRYIEDNKDSKYYGEPMLDTYDAYEQAKKNWTTSHMKLKWVDG